MELNNLNIDSMYASWFLLTLFFKTERKYTCTKLKTSQLLTIIALDYAINGCKVFNDDILKKENEEIYIGGLNGLSKREYIGAKNQKDDQKYICESLDDSKEYMVPWMYRCNIKDDKFKEKATDVFRCFGSYSQQTLTDMINPILNKIIDKDGVVNLDNVSSIINEMDENNTIVDYLKQNNLEENIKIKIIKK